MLLNLAKCAYPRLELFTEIVVITDYRHSLVEELVGELQAARLEHFTELVTCDVSVSIAVVEVKSFDHLLRSTL